MAVSLKDKLNGRFVQHKRTKVIRQILVLEEGETPSTAAIDGTFDPVKNILFDTYESTQQLYNLL